MSSNKVTKKKVDEVLRFADASHRNSLARSGKGREKSMLQSKM